jgi:hypothetical protein
MRERHLVVLAVCSVLVIILINNKQLHHTVQTNTSAPVESYGQRLPEDKLLQYAIEAASWFGLETNNEQRKSLVASDGVVILFGDWIDATGGTLEEGAIEWGLPERPVFVLPIIGTVDETKMLGYLPPLSGETPKPVTKTMYVAVFADTGEPASAHSYEDVSLSPLAQF